ncbi:MAG: M20/M25/M40 family metallo-hydrolase [Planctomycetaceae bacterium]
MYGRLGGSGEDSLRVMLMAHADEVGLMITSLRPDGFLRFTRVGHPTQMVLPGQRVRVLSKTGALAGVVGVKPGHVLSGEAARLVPAIEELFIDVGAESGRQLEEWGIEAGTPVAFVGPLTATRHPQRYVGKGIDNRAGLVCLLESARALSASRPNCEVWCVVTVEEEIGLRGALVAAAKVRPDVVIAIDTVPAGGTPDLSPEQLPWRIGAGPLLKVRETSGLSTHGPLRELMRQAAEAEQIPYQMVVDTAGITDATAAQQASGEIAAMVLGLARRYSHSAVEMIDLRDVDSLIALVVATVHRLQNREQLLRY